ncbi:UDP-N-acetylmuramoyl-tripeptide--D-alanyl-D-alanine ligase [Thiorhodovibrio frisius]|uniref:UDP-N-acetylmuramoyl-tripeptide--D-alanyl-D-alanine ligase n=1 Tax=Thiorhodovibrio frisius TaxID=631362 RepID=H8Z3I7_9GAMM|nr:UDP-N-acetylmuramoyl-tripeptide--D-alanyl-D-alanine ligase [Thiorhodovibrio frisius]EIC21895.1 UDP-N-acetylmuramoyl-tripeptide--D-alanyl-D-alanine ligase [Thiorhodovibrio frisius]WPL24184.1 UDP-N-acetylmuramoyl-tripeptide--D-alanyl-D-alanine ligase [Thiorhodovibrio frisius]
MWTLAQATASAGGRLEGADLAFDGVTTDSRQDCQGKLFVALSGERFDGHAYVATAAERGAVAAMVSRPVAVDLPQWIVDDPLQGLGRLAAAWRARFKGRVIAITGSNGKTTCKEMTAAICRQVGATRATAGNLNNAIGMPLTLLAARDEAFLILEMGANHHGEIGYLSGIAAPDVAVITNAGRAHLEGFGSLEGVARAKGEIASGLGADGTFAFMADVPWTPLWQELAGTCRRISFGTGPGAELRADPDSIRTRWDQDGFRTLFDAWLPGQDKPWEIGLGLAGRHNVNNALAAMALALALDLPVDAIAHGLALLQPVARRLQPRRTAEGVRLIDDSYNANPDSLAAAVDVLVDLPGRHLLVLGDFGELGPESAKLHADMGRRALDAGVERLFAVGDLAGKAASAFGDQGAAFATQAELLRALKGTLQPDDVVLVKGSRLAGMDRIADALCTGGKMDGLAMNLEAN